MVDAVSGGVRCGVDGDVRRYGEALLEGEDGPGGILGAAEPVEKVAGDAEASGERSKQRRRRREEGRREEGKQGKQKRKPNERGFEGYSQSDERFVQQIDAIAVVDGSIVGEIESNGSAIDAFVAIAVCR